MTTINSPAFENILNQPAALQESLAWHTGPGRAALARAAALLQQASQIAVVSIGASYNASLSFVQRFAAAGKRVILEDAAEFLHYTHHAYTAPTLFVFVSRSGASVEIVKSLALLHGRGHTTIGLTNEPDSPLAHDADLALLFGGPNDHLIAFQTYLTTLLTLDLLADAALGGMAAIDAPAFRGELDGLLQAVAAAVAQYDPRRQSSWRFDLWRGVYLLGRGPGFGSALQAALMFHEVARYPAQAFTAGAFRHGPWEVAEAGVRFFIFAPPDHCYPLNLALAGDLAELDAEVFLLGSTALPETGFQSVARLALPPVAPRWSPYLEIIPMQFFIYEFAVWQGLVPGVFRASTGVLRSETGSLLNGLT